MRTFAAAIATACAVAALAVSLPARPAAAAARYALIVLSHANHTVYEVDPGSGRILHRVVVPDEPHEAAISPDGRTIYVTLPMAGFVQAINAQTFALTRRIDSPYFRRPPVKQPDGHTTTSAFPHGIALNSEGTKLYVGVEEAVVPGLVEVDLQSGRARKIDIGLKGGHAFQIQPGTDWLYYPFRGSDTVVVFDTATDRKIATFPVKGGPVGVGFAPNGDVWFHEDGNGTVTVASSMTNRIERVIQTGGKGAGRLAVSPDGRYAASTHADSQDVAILDARTKQLLGSVHTGKGPAFPIFSPDGTTLFVMNSGEGDVAVVDVKTRTVTARWKVGTDPFGGGLRYLASRARPGGPLPVRPIAAGSF